ncbi:MAG: hypothetical protein AAF485_01980 [Chloroflexota bacterium]
MPTIYADKANKSKRKPYDLYITEPNLIRAALDVYRPSKSRSILDAGANDGRWGQIAKGYYPKAQLTGADIRSMDKPISFDQWHTLDYLTWWPSQSYDLIVSNPPFNLAEPFIKHSWNLLPPNGTMIMLLLHDFITSDDRAMGLWLTHSPARFVPIAKRPCFDGTNKGWTHNCAIYVWQKDKRGQNAVEPYSWQSGLLLYDREDGKGQQGRRRAYASRLSKVRQLSLAAIVGD